MAGTILLASKALFAAAGCGAGIVLAGTAWRERGLPVHAWASAAIFVGGLGLIGFGAAPALEARSASLAGGLMVASDGLQRAALAALALFLWRVFGGRARSPRTGVLALVLGALAVDGLVLLRVQEWPRPLPAALAAGSQLVFATPFVWATVETGLAWRAARRRLALGLAEPAVVNRFGLFAVGCGCFVGINLATAGSKLPAAAPLALGLDLGRALLYAATALFVVLAFYPPAAYRRRVAASGGA